MISSMHSTSIVYEKEPASKIHSVSFMIPFSRTISFVMSPHLRFPFMEFFLLSSKACSIVCLRSILVRPQFISTQPVLCK